MPLARWLVEVSLLWLLVGVCYVQHPSLDLKGLAYLALDQVFLYAGALASSIFHELPYSAALLWCFQRVYPQEYVFYLLNEDYSTLLYLAGKVGFSVALRYLAKASMTNVEIDFFATLLLKCADSFQSRHSIILFNLLLSWLLGVLVSLVPMAYLHWLTIYGNYAYAASLAVFSYMFLELQNEYTLEPFVYWFWKYLVLSPLRIQVLLYWLVCLVIIGLTLGKIAFNPVANESTLNMNRKVWHYVIFMIIVPVLKFQDQLEFVKIVLLFLIVGFLQIETARYSGVPLGRWIDSLLSVFKDSRDLQGPVLVSYLYLLLGISLPIFLNDSCMGLIALGIGDSTASIVGKKWGKTLSLRWFDTQKTVIGTIAFILSSFLACYGLKRAGFQEFELHTASDLLVISLIGGLIEAMSDLNDNVLLPCVMTIASTLFQGI